MYKGAKSKQELKDILPEVKNNIEVKSGYKEENIKYKYNDKEIDENFVLEGKENSTITIKVTADAPVEVNFKKGNHIKGSDKKTTIQKGQSLEEAWDKIKSTVEYYDDYEFYRFEDAKGNEIKDSKEMKTA